MEIVPLSDAVGAEIRGVDLRESLSAKTFDQIEKAFHDFAIVLLRDQDVTLEQQKIFALKFGELGTVSYTHLTLPTIYSV